DRCGRSRGRTIRGSTRHFTARATGAPALLHNAGASMPAAAQHSASTAVRGLPPASGIQILSAGQLGRHLGTSEDVTGPESHYALRDLLTRAEHAFTRGEPGW